MSDLDPTEYHELYEVTPLSFPNQSLLIREYEFHPVNANQVWPGSIQFATWILSHWDLFEGKKVLEIGSGCGALAIWLAKRGLKVITSDYTDVRIEENLRENCRLNDLPPLPHISHIWGTPFPRESLCEFDTVLASDILIYVSQYTSLVGTLHQVLAAGAVCYLSNRRRIDTEDTFLSLCTQSGLTVRNLGAKVFEISKERREE